MDLKLLSLDSIQTVCRTCMGKGPLISVFLSSKKYSVKFSEMLYACLSLKVIILFNYYEMHIFF